MPIKRNYLLNLSNSLLNILFPVITFPYASRILSPEGIGNTQVIFSYAQYFSLIAAFGIPIYGVKVIAENLDSPLKLSKTTSELLILNTISALVCVSLYFLVGFQIALFSDYKSELIIASSMVLISMFNVDWYFGAKGQFDVLLKRSIFVKALSLVLLFATVNSYSDRLWYLIFLLFIWVGTYLINAVLLFSNQKLTWSHLNLKRHLKPLFLILSMTLATTIYTSLDSVVLSYFSGDTEVGFYTAGVKLSKVAIPILTSLGVVIIPRATQFNLSGDTIAENKLYSKSFSLTAFLSIPISIGLYSVSSEAISVFSGPAFSEAITSMQKLAFLPIFIGFGHMLSFQVLVPKGINHGMFWSTVIGMILFGLLAYLLMPKYGSDGASIANLSTEIIVTCIYLLFIPLNIRKAFPWRKIPFAIIASAPFVAIAYLVRSFVLPDLATLIIIIILSAFTYFIIQKMIFKESLIDDGLALLKRKANLNG